MSVDSSKGVCQHVLLVKRARRALNVMSTRTPLFWLFSAVYQRMQFANRSARMTALRQPLQLSRNK